MYFHRQINLLLSLLLVLATRAQAWKVDFVLISAVMGMYLIVEGMSAELILFGLSCIYGFLGIITGDEAASGCCRCRALLPFCLHWLQAWAGIASSSVIGLALLFPIASAIEETGSTLP